MAAVIGSLGEAFLSVGLLMVAVSFVAARTPLLLRITSIASFLLLAAWLLTAVIGGVLEGRATELSTHDEWFPRRENEQLFWGSVVFHGAIACALGYVGFRLAAVPHERWLLIARKAAFSGLLRFAGWLFLALMVWFTLIATRVYEITP